MSPALIAAIALTTYGSRAFALVLMPYPPERIRIILDRIPASLFASLAALSMVDGGAMASPATICAAAGALLAAPLRSLLWVLAGGLLGYAIGVLVLA